MLFPNITEAIASILVEMKFDWSARVEPRLDNVVAEPIKDAAKARRHNRQPERG